MSATRGRTTWTGLSSISRSLGSVSTEAKKKKFMRTKKFIVSHYLNKETFGEVRPKAKWVPTATTKAATRRKLAGDEVDPNSAFWLTKVSSEEKVLRQRYKERNFRDYEASIVEGEQRN